VGRLIGPSARRDRRRLGPAATLAVLALLLVGAATAAVRDEDGAELARVEAYLNAMTTLRSDFVQINPDGGTATGTLYYARPSKMRLDYDPPSDLLIIANGWQLIYHDRRLEQTSHLFSNSTPLGFLLDEQIRFNGEDVTVTAVEQDEGEIRITLVQSQEPDQGAVTLVFADRPLALRRWHVVDAQGLVTHVVLERIETGMPLDDDLFVFRNPQFYPGARN
jgi:outer membrane lipoprotein-sorting protein